MNTMVSTPQAFLESQGWPFRYQRQELVTACPFCSKLWHLYLHREKGVWKCHHCGEKGNLDHLQQRVVNGDSNGIRSLADTLRSSPPQRIDMDRVESMHAALLADQEALAYCTQTRKWALEIIKRFKIGLKVNERGKRIAYPWWRCGECVGIKYRLLPTRGVTHAQRFEREPGCESILFNADAIGAHQEIIVASGESDALALLTLGFENVVATTTGEGSLPASAVDALAKKQRILIPFDNDQAGQKGAREIAKRIGLDKTWLVRLPADVKDVNEFLVHGGTREEFDKLLAQAVQFDVPSVNSLSQALDRLEEEKTLGESDHPADVTPWPSLNRRLGAWRPGNLVVLSGPQGTGKTTFALNVASRWAAQGFPALVYCLEMHLTELAQHILCAHYRLPEDEITQPVINNAKRDLVNWPLYLGANPSITGRKEVVDLLGQAIRRYGLKFLVFDNLHMLARSIEHRTEEIGVISKAFKLLAMEHEIPIVLIAQPRKLQPEQVMTPWDIKDSVDIYSDADQVILLHREFTAARHDGKAIAEAEAGEVDNVSPITLVRIAKGRHVPLRDALLYIEGAQHRFREITQEDKNE